MIGITEFNIIYNKTDRKIRAKVGSIYKKHLKNLIVYCN